MTLDQRQVDAPLESGPEQTAASGAINHARRIVWRERVRRAAGRVIPVALAVGALLLAWQLYASRPDADQQILPTPVAVWSALIAQREPLWGHTLVTLYETAVGFTTALVAGVVFAALIDFSPWLRRAIYPLLVVSQTIPIITLAPLLVLWFGFGVLSKTIVITLVCFFPITVALADGLRGADPELIRLYRTFGADRWRIFRSVKLPGALPSLFSGVRIAVAYSVIGAIFAEYVGAEAGLGFYIQQKQHGFATAAVLAAIVVTALLSLALFGLVALIERLALPWYYLQRRQSRS
jgi:ABC-type nitrate/sulfonate/bicarbonate transport system permease component